MSCGGTLRTSFERFRSVVQEMRRPSVSVVQLEERKKSVSPRKRANLIAEGQNIVAVAGANESTLVEVERTWLKGRLVVGLEKTRAVLDVICRV